MRAGTFLVIEFADPMFQYSSAIATNDDVIMA